ncbi:methyltransferase domain-containing protein [Nocardia sp. CDC159]|uniref:Methyltransferase domain-containing protein n=1 Tax=Nocardia pulmonis TaxID=2951408 RepID=A0A9X2E7W4_9NOCA|nr:MULTISPECIES: methyltransferase domain-containing protein [Nocardia]MCM6774828.1 methyltransferase domain-containing protein [Nocardia pulmonis]MCM6789759.1 methyltransferase domain-containing protein [Nocardia sp. CDC159]
MNLARRTMNHPAFALVYERAWRPAAFYVATGRTMQADRRDAARTLRLRPGATVLDVACGPGNFTHYLSERLDDDGFAIGLDFSAPMLRRARADNSGPRVGYVRGDARRLPFADGRFDAVCCFGALYLIPDPLDAAREMIRMLAPGGRIAISTSQRRDTWFGRVSSAVGGAGGLRVFDIDTFPKLFAQAGLVDIHQEIHGLLQYVSATRPQ